MSKPLRAGERGLVDDTLNRADAPKASFAMEADYAAFEK